MLRIIKITLIILAILSGTILAILFLQDRTKKLEEREYKEINSIVVATDNANINFHKSKDEKVKVVVYGSSKDFVEIIEGSKSLTISKMTGNTNCFLNCKNEVNIYIPENNVKLDIKSDKGNITSDVSISNIKINSKLGNVTLSKINTIDSTIDAGNIVIDEINANNNSNIKTNIGNITINKIVNLKIDANSEEGSVVIPVVKEEQDFTLKIESSKGNIDIDHYESKSE